MKNKLSMFVLLAEIIVIVVLHTARNPRTDADRPAANQPSQSNHFTIAEERPSPYISLK
jgi:hypothetical protein